MEDLKKVSPDQDWSLCSDGSRHERAVRGAVEDFAAQHGLVVAVMYESDTWKSWILQKPTIPECVQSSQM
jgi:hypothetical protein